MPLPPAPTKRAALLPPQAFEASARSPETVTRKTEAAADELLIETPPAQEAWIRHRGLRTGVLGLFSWSDRAEVQG